MKKVEFYVDSLVGSRRPYQTERSAPYELAGGSAFDTSGLTDGPHTVTARITLKNGKKSTATADFSVSNAASPAPAPAPTPAHELLVSRSADRSNPVALDGAEVSGGIYAFTSQRQDVRKVVFHIDDVERTGTPFGADSTAPFELAGGAPYDTTALSDGPPNAAFGRNQRVGPSPPVGAGWGVAARGGRQVGVVASGCSHTHWEDGPCPVSRRSTPAAWSASCRCSTG